VCSFAGIVFIDHGGKGLDPTQSVAQIGDGFAGLTGEARTAAALIGAATALSLIFLGPLWAHLRRGPSWLAVIAVAGGIASAGLLLITCVLSIAAATAGEVGDGQTARTLLIIEWEAARVAVPPSLVTVAAATLAGLRFRVFPRAFSLLSLVMAAILTVAILPLGPAGLLGFVGPLWVLVASLMFAFGGARSLGHRSAD